MRCMCQRQQSRAPPLSPSAEETPRTHLLQELCLARSLAPLLGHLTVLLVTQRAARGRQCPSRLGTGTWVLGPAWDEVRAVTQPM